MVLYGLSWVPLIAYMFIIAVLSATVPTAGVITVAVLLVMDFICFVAIVSGRVKDARVVVVALTLTRMVSVVFGDMYFMIGHSIVYLCLTLMYAKYTIDRFLPLRTNESEQRDMMEGALCARWCVRFDRDFCVCRIG